MQQSPAFARSSCRPLALLNSLHRHGICRRRSERPLPHVVVNRRSHIHFQHLRRVLAKSRTRNLHAKPCSRPRKMGISLRARYSSAPTGQRSNVHAQRLRFADESVHPLCQRGFNFSGCEAQFQKLFHRSHFNVGLSLRRSH